MRTEKCCRVQVVRAIAGKLEFSFLLKIWNPAFPKFLSVPCTKYVVVCDVAIVPIVLAKKKFAVFNGLVFV